jgi:type I restriction enzyme M protein
MARGDKEYFCRLVKNSEISDNAYNISVSSYIEQEDTREVVDIHKLNAEIAAIVERENALRTEIDKIVADLEGELS